MPSTNPFPGMDPYLEHSVLWPGVHNGLISEIRKQIAPLVRPRYAVSIEERVFVESPSDARVPDVWIQENPRRGPSFRESSEGGVAVAPEPDVAEPILVSLAPFEIVETYLEILDLYQNQRVVTVIEVVSPTNKSTVAGRKTYLTKQRATLESETHLVEIDLLRDGPWVIAVPREPVVSRVVADYHMLVSRSDRRMSPEVYPCHLRERLPRFRIPLAAPDPDVVLDLQAALNQVHEDGSYCLRIRYDRPCDPALSAADQEWAKVCVSTFRAAHPEWYPPKTEVAPSPAAPNA